MDPDEQWCIAELRPGACLSLFGMPGTSFKNAAYLLRHLNVPLADCIELACEKGFSHERLESTLADFASPSFQLSKPIEEAMGLLSSSKRVPISQVERQSGIHGRQLHRYFEKLVGLSPKNFQRISRLRLALDAAACTPSQSWTQIAMACGYYDQPHLTNELTALLSLTPRQIKRIT